MRHLVMILIAAVLTVASVPVAQAARVTNLRVTAAPSWEQWIEQGTVKQGHLGFWEQTACSRTEPRLTYTLARTTEPATSTTPVPVGYLGTMVPLTLGPRIGGAAQQHLVEFGPVSVPMHDVFYGQAGRDPNSTPINQLGRWILAVNVDARGATDLLRNWRTVKYRGVAKPAGACAAAGLDTYNVLAVGP